MTSFTPSVGTTGTTVTVYGTGFSATVAQNTVMFNGTAGTVLESSPSVLTVSVPSGASTGPIAVTSPSGNATSAANFTVSSGTSGAPTITGFTPTIGTPGTAVTVSGTNFDATALNDRTSFNIINSSVSSATTTSISTTVPQAGSGHVSVATQYGKATSSADFFIPPSPYSPADVVSTARIVTGGAVSFSITSTGKVALALFDGLEGHRVFLNITSVVSGGNTTVAILNPNGTTLNQVTASGTTSTYIDATTLPATGTYTIEFAPWAITANASATCTLTEVAPDFVSSITLGGASVTATTTTAGQNARLTFSGTSGQRISMRLSSVTVPSTTNVIIYNPNTTILTTTSTGTGGFFMEPVQLASTGTFTILLDPNATNTGSITVSLYDVAADITGTITIGGAAVSPSISTPGQNASYTFSGTASQKISMTFTSVTVTTVNVIVKKPDGSNISNTVVGTSGGFQDQTNLPVSGTYTLVVDPQIHYTGNITITLYDATEVTSTITPGGSPITLSLSSPGKTGVLTFSGSAGQTVSLVISGVSIGGSTPINLFNPSGGFVTGGSFGTGGGFIDAVSLSSNGTYKFVADPTGTNTGSATFALYDCADVTGTITPGGSAVATTISIPGQNARLSFSGTAGQRISLNLTNITIASEAVTVFKPDGTALIPVGGISTSSFFYDTRTLPTTGTYSIFLNPNSTNTGSFTATLYDVPADVSGSVTIGGSAVGVTTTVPGQNGSLTFSGTSSQQVTVHITGNTMGSVTVKLLKPDGTTLTTSTSSAASFNLSTQTLPTTGTYTISIDPAGTNTGTINVSVTSP